MNEMCLWNLVSHRQGHPGSLEQGQGRLISLYRPKDTRRTKSANIRTDKNRETCNVPRKYSILANEKVNWKGSNKSKGNRPIICKMAVFVRGKRRLPMLREFYHNFITESFLIRICDATINGNIRFALFLNVVLGPAHKRKRLPEHKEKLTRWMTTS